MLIVSMGIKLRIVYLLMIWINKQTKLEQNLVIEHTYITFRYEI